MSIKDLFNKTGTPKIQKTVSTDDLVDQIESSDFVEAKRKQFDEFVPPIDFASASNFAKFGSAELYYEKAFERIHQYYPYDGTLHEKIEFENSSSYLDKYVFDNLYPRTNGYLRFLNTNFITIDGGPHTASAGMIGKTLDSTFDDSMIYNESKKRTSAFEFRGEDGITVEFWFKADSTSNNCNIFHVSASHDNTNDYQVGEIKLEQLANGATSHLKMTIASGSVSPVEPNFENIITDTDWNHYAITVVSASDGLIAKSYKNGHLFLQDSAVARNIPHILPMTNGLNMRIGKTHQDTNLLTGSLDEFRFWKTARTPEDIFNTFFIPVGGGTNKHDANIALSCYLKFNEGSTGNAALDQTALDYSGRINNGIIQNYSAAQRSTGSAITEKLGEPEFLDPIIYSSHPDVISKKAEYKTSGSLADLENSSTFFNYFPGWMQEEDEQNGNQLKFLSKILGSYFDTLYHQIGFLNKIHDHHYISGSNKALPFAKKLLYNQGFVMPDLFVDATKLEYFRQKDDNEVFEKEVNEVRNIIYHNIYNNLNSIYKSKGTEKAFRNFFRSIGVGEDLVKLRMYADDSTFVLRNNYQYKSYERKFLDFNVDGHFDATIFQTSASSDGNNNIYIPGDSNYTGSFTLQAEIILPRKQRSNEPNYNPYPYLTASVAGYHRAGNHYDHLPNEPAIQATATISFTGKPSEEQTITLVDADGTSKTFEVDDDNDGTVVASNIALVPGGSSAAAIAAELASEINGEADLGITATNPTATTVLLTMDAAGSEGNTTITTNFSNSTVPAAFTGGVDEDRGLQIYVVHSASEGTLNPDDKQRIKFVLTGSNSNSEIELVTPWFSQQYENNKWSIAVRMKHATYPTPNIAGTTIDDYLLEFYGVEADGNTERNSFSLSKPAVAHTYYSSDKIFYAGAHNANFTGSTLQHTDIKLGYLRYWHSYLSNDAIKQHAFDSETFGTNEPFEQDIINVYPSEIPREKTLGFHWAFHDLTSSNTDGTFLVSDLSSGSFSSDYGSLSDTIQRYVAAKGKGFNSSTSTIVDKNFLYSARKRLPDDLMSSDLTTIKSDETEQFFVDEDVSDNFYSFEKSMWGTISDEMMNMFSTALDLNNLIGQPNQKYHHRYNLAEFLRDRFFDDVENEPDIEKFTSFYKWIDDSISIAVQQLCPASTRFSQKINNIIESHVLERNKYVHQIPIVTEFRSTEGSIKGITEMKYDWQFGHAPTDPDNEGNHVLWQKERKQRSDGSLREILRISRNNHSIQSSGLRRIDVDGSTRISDTYAVRRFAKTQDLTIVSQETIHGGTNFGRKKNLQLFHESIAPAGALGSVTSTPQNIITVGVGAGSGRVEEPPNNDLSPRKKKHNLNVLIGNRSTNEYGYKLSGDFVIPFNLMSGSVKSGFNSIIDLSYSSGVYVTNLHHDIVGNYNETSIQGPFTEQHVGGLQYRHIDLNTGNDGETTRAEGWRLLFSDHPAIGADADGAFGFVGPDYESPYPSKTLVKANRYREEHAKRPVNIKNIKTISGSQKVGNYANELELFQVSPTFQKTWAIEAYDDPNVNILPTGIAGTLPDSTQYQTLIGRDPNTAGNVFGVMNNNRQIDSTLGSPLSLAINSGETTTITHRLAADTTVSGYSTTGNKSISFWINLDNDSTAKRYVFTIYNTTGGGDTLAVYFGFNNLQLFTRSTGGSKTFKWNVTMSDFVGTWKNVAIVWNGNQSSNPVLYINNSSEGTPDSTSGSGTGTTLSTMNGISVLDRFGSNSVSDELQGSLMNLGIWEAAFIADNIATIYNSGIVLKSPILQGSLIDFYYLGNELSGLSIGDEIPNGTVVSSSFGSGNNHLTAQDGLSIVQGFDTTLRAFVDHIPLNQSNVIMIPRTDLTGSQRNIITRFSAPGGPEVQSIGYLDAYTTTYSVHNVLPYRNSSVLGSGSGEQGTIRVEDHLGHRRGLKTLRALHMGKFGSDATYGIIESESYVVQGSFNKQHRNESNAYIWNTSADIIASLSETDLITGSNYDNMHINTSIPRSELQYSWIHNATSGAANVAHGAPTQRILGYAPRDGIVSSSAGYVEAIVFPTASSIFSF